MESGIFGRLYKNPLAPPSVQRQSPGHAEVVQISTILQKFHWKKFCGCFCWQCETPPPSTVRAAI
ncbi:MAG: hypothetical protein IPL35_05730 [Sphingobacteriales bacterium]|nr:hypothetical protein [Sphingobacteriales bacterium]